MVVFECWSFIWKNVSFLLILLGFSGDFWILFSLILLPWAAVYLWFPWVEGEGRIFKKFLIFGELKDVYRSSRLDLYTWADCCCVEDFGCLLKENLDIQFGQVAVLRSHQYSRFAGILEIILLEVGEFLIFILIIIVIIFEIILQIIFFSVFLLLGGFLEWN